MEPTSPAAPDYQKLGQKTFIFFLFERLRVAMIFLFLAIVLFVLSSQSFLAKAGSLGNLQGYALMGGWLTLALFAVALLITLLASWLIYVNYRFALDEDSLRIKHGVFDKEEVAIPYRQIQNINIERDLSYQMLGMSRLVILTAGHEDKPNSEDESEGILPALDKDKAEWLQNELLKRSNIERVTEIKPQ
jgi:uncharacterized membrane protein YdbT with pleckstrin-like domain